MSDNTPDIMHLPMGSINALHAFCLAGKSIDDVGCLTSVIDHEIEQLEGCRDDLSREQGNTIASNRLADIASRCIEELVRIRGKVQDGPTPGRQDIRLVLLDAYLCGSANAAQATEDMIYGCQ